MKPSTTTFMKNHITKLTLSIFLALIVSSCSPFTYVGNNKARIPAHPKFYVKSVVTNVEEHRILPLGLDSNKNDLMTDDEVNDYVKEKIVNYLKSENLYSELSKGEDVFECNFTINFSKNYYMFTNFKYAGTSMNNYNIAVLKDGESFAGMNDSNIYVITGRGLGFGGSLRMLSFRLNKDDEKNMIGIFAGAVAGNMKYFNR